MGRHGDNPLRDEPFRDQPTVDRTLPRSYLAGPAEAIETHR